MKAHPEQDGRIPRSVQGGDALTCSDATLSDVRINRISKPSMSEVASTA